MLTRLLLVLAFWAALGAPGAAQVQPLIHDDSDRFFGEIKIPELRIWIEPRQMDRLSAAPREYALATMTENNGAIYGSVGVKLKGAAGSYRNWDDRPALTLNMKKFNKYGAFHGLRKFHLNNSVQDGTYLNEFASSELFRKAGIPAPRVSFARVWLNDRDVGFYVLKEGFDELFVKRYFPDAKGNLYEGPFCADIDAPLEKDSGKGPDDRSDLKAVMAAVDLGDPVARRRETLKVVDVEEFALFMAMERLTCHWDGYCQNRNNYRIYFNQGRASFLPHGMDQMFGNTSQGLLDGSGSRVARVMTEDPEFKAILFRQAAAASSTLSPPDWLLARIDLAHQQMRPVLEKMSPGRGEQNGRDAAGLKQRLVERGEFLRKHIAAERANMPPEFDPSGETRIPEWFSQTANGAVAADEPVVDGRPTYHLKITGDSGVASWRGRMLLGRGVYTLSADLWANNVVATDDNLSGIGVGLSGAPRTQRLSGTFGRQTVSHEFSVSEDRKQAEFVLELRAKSGEVWFDAGSLKLTRKPLP
ncbi:MAG TPA: CotH kinase family protein [Pirellulales bacterium]